MDSMDTMEVNLESPAARSAEGVMKLTDHSGIWAMELIRKTTKISRTISSGG
ncbi:hypothetical protein D3C73_1584430 [compost metagenome]